MQIILLMWKHSFQIAIGLQQQAFQLIKDQINQIVIIILKIPKDLKTKEQIHCFSTTQKFHLCLQIFFSLAIQQIKCFIFFLLSLMILLKKRLFKSQTLQYIQYLDKIINQIKFKQRKPKIIGFIKSLLKIYHQFFKIKLYSLQKSVQSTKQLCLLDISVKLNQIKIIYSLFNKFMNQAEKFNSLVYISNSTLIIIFKWFFKLYCSIQLISCYNNNWNHYFLISNIKLKAQSKDFQELYGIYLFSSLRFFYYFMKIHIISQKQFIIGLISNFCLSSIILIIILFSMNDEIPIDFIEKNKVILGWFIIYLVFIAIFVEFCVLIVGIFIYIFQIYKIIQNMSILFYQKAKQTSIFFIDQYNKVQFKINILSQLLGQQLCIIFLFLLLFQFQILFNLIQIINRFVIFKFLLTTLNQQ
ncbi:unnamed protein product [Paramecium sonneborni]|uniref:Transmembrane protein n=1 Tax=Paramecium sonneborni TaxID=65129 RepID=A0A8S1P3S0_9CILI|nr:unnamed protein product [Paramecium sonneborni]